MYSKSAIALVAAAAALASSASAQATVWNFAQELTSSGPQTGNGAGNAWWYFYADPGDRDGAYTLFSQPSSFASGVGYDNSPPNAFQLVIGTGVYGNPDSGLLHPGTFNFTNPASNPEPDVIVGWRAPSAATVNVSGFFRDGDGSDFDGPTDARGIRAEITSTTTPGAANSDVNLVQFATAYLDASNDNEAIRTLLGGLAILPTVAAFDFNITVAANQWLFFRVNDLGSNRFDSTEVSIIIDDNIRVPEAGSLGALGLGLLGFGLAARRRTA
jgi:hypothetical protein